jgi:glycolate oxidase FAD binding subunit
MAEAQLLTADGDLAEALADQVRRAAQARRPLRIVGGDTKRWYGRAVEGERLELGGHRGIVSHDPSELVLTARAGTPLNDIEARLADHGQMLGFEPLSFGAAGTIGGAVATGLCGQRRPFAGATRDFVLGVTVLDGRGRRLRFGGTVFKNVAGFDAFRLMAGAMGQLGVILEVSLRVVPRPRREAALALELASEAAREWLTQRRRAATAISGAFHDGARLHLRLSGGEAGVAATRRELGGESEALALWEGLRRDGHPALTSDGPVWRLSLSSDQRPPVLGALLAWDWAGAQGWLSTDLEPERMWRAAAEAGGHATLFRPGDAGADEVFQPLPASMLALHQRLKAALDPAGVLNPGRMYREL